MKPSFPHNKRRIDSGLGSGVNLVLVIWLLAILAFCIAMARGATTWTNTYQTVMVQGTNTSTNTVPKWLKRNTIGNSLITDDGTTIGLNAGVHVGGTSAVADNNLLVDGEIQTVGRVGVGVAPLGSGTSLTVSGVGNNYVSEANTGVKIYSPGDAQLRIGADPGSNIGFIQSGVEGTGAGLPLVLQANNGNVGVGFIAPGARFAVDGGANIGSTTDPGDNNLLVQGRLGIGYDGFWGSHPFSIVYSGTYNNENLGSMYLFSAAGDTAMHIGTDAANDVGFISTLAQATSWTSRPLALQPNGGRVGIGTIVPSATLSVIGGVGVGTTLDPGPGRLVVTNFMGVGLGGMALSNNANNFSLAVAKRSDDMSGRTNSIFLGWWGSGLDQTGMEFRHIWTDAMVNRSIYGVWELGAFTPVFESGTFGGMYLGGTNATPNGFMHVAPGTTSMAPLVLEQSSSVLATKKSGAIEHSGTNLFFTDTNSIRYKVLLNWTNYDDVSVGALTVPGGAAAPTLGDFAGASTLQVYHFDAAQDDTVYFSCQLPHTYVQSAAIIPHVHWVRTAAPGSASNTNVVWELNYSWSSIDSPFAATTQLLVTNSVASANWTHQLSYWPAIAGSTNKVSSILVGRVRRLGSSSAGDTYDQDVGLLAIDLHVPVDLIVKDTQ